jgi:hypothetical protein
MTHSAWTYSACVAVLGLDLFGSSGCMRAEGAPQAKRAALKHDAHADGGFGHSDASRSSAAAADAGPTTRTRKKQKSKKTGCPGDKARAAARCIPDNEDVGPVSF